ncbi:MAG: hypothetical protein IKF90_15790, partial [Parasporobacterium sp.]|nr:hypothetical protein [Parasporobacterium sp.]
TQTLVSVASSASVASTVSACAPSSWIVEAFSSLVCAAGSLPVLPCAVPQPHMAIITLSITVAVTML